MVLFESVTACYLEHFQQTCANELDQGNNRDQQQILQQIYQYFHCIRFVSELACQAALRSSNNFWNRTSLLNHTNRLSKLWMVTYLLASSNSEPQSKLFDWKANSTFSWSACVRFLIKINERVNFVRGMTSKSYFLVVRICNFHSKSSSSPESG